MGYYSIVYFERVKENDLHNCPICNTETENPANPHYCGECETNIRKRIFRTRQTDDGITIIDTAGRVRATIKPYTSTEIQSVGDWPRLVTESGEEVAKRIAHISDPDVLAEIWQATTALSRVAIKIRLALVARGMELSTAGTWEGKVESVADAYHAKRTWVYEHTCVIRKLGLGLEKAEDYPDLGWRHLVAVARDKKGITHALDTWKQLTDEKGRRGVSTRDFDRAIGLRSERCPHVRIICELTGEYLESLDSHCGRCTHNGNG